MHSIKRKNNHKTRKVKRQIKQEKGVENTVKESLKPNTPAIKNVDGSINNEKYMKKINQKNKKNIDFFDEVQRLLRNSNYDKKNLEQKIEIAWLDVKPNFVSFIRQKSMYNKISVLFNKGNMNTKYDIVKATLNNIYDISCHEHSKRFILTVAKDNKKFLVSIIKKITLLSRKLVSNRNGLFILDEIYKISNRKSRKETIYNILYFSDKVQDNSDLQDFEKEDLSDNNINTNEDLLLDAENDNGCINKDNIAQLDAEHICNSDTTVSKNVDCSCTPDILERNKALNTGLIKKLSSKRLWKYIFTHDLLCEYLKAYPKDTQYILDLLIRNKQMNLLLCTYKGLEACLFILSIDNVSEILRILTKNFMDVVNNEYGSIFILKILELNRSIEKIIDIYVENYRDIFINEVSILPLIYIFNQEKKYFPTLFNQLREKDLINTNKNYLLSKFKSIIIENLTVFMNTFSWILVYFFCKKDNDVKKQVCKLLNSDNYIKNEFSEKLKKKMIKYKLFK